MSSQGTPKKAHTKRFLSRFEKEKVYQMFLMNISSKELQRLFGVSQRRIRNIIKEFSHGQINIWTAEEYLTLIQYVKKGIVKEWQLTSVFPKKSPWMIRNRINFMKKKNFNIESILYPFVPKEDSNVVFDPLCETYLCHQETDFDL